MRQPDLGRRRFLEIAAVGAGALALPGRAFALRYYPRPSDKKWAVVYATWCGSARDAAVWISEGMGGIADVFDVREDPDPRGFDHLVLGGAIRMGEVSPDFQRWIAKNREALAKRIRGLFFVCGNLRKPLGSAERERYIDRHLAELTGSKGVPARGFLGRITEALLEPEARETLEKFGLLGDYDNLKRSECLEFGKEILAALK